MLCYYYMRVSDSMYVVYSIHSPLHDNQQTFPSLIKVLVDINDAYNVGTR